MCFLQLIANALAAAISRGARQTRHGAQVARSADEHQASLRELQHRVRNDLQAIYYAVEGEARHAADPLQRAGFERVSRRVMALAGLYDHLLGARLEGSVDMGPYLSLLCDKITDATGLASRAIELRVDAQRLRMPLRRALQIAVAVAVNELVANAAEHAFPDRRPGTITVRLLAKGEDGTGCPVVTVADDGCGFQDTRPGSAGLGFVERLVRQAGGVLAREDGAGTRWHMEIAS